MENVERSASEEQQMSGTPTPDESPTMKRLTSEDRQAQLALRISREVADGWRVESQAPLSATLVKGKSVNHVLHIILSILSLGFWFFFYIPYWLIRKERRKVLTVDAYGNIM